MPDYPHLRAVGADERVPPGEHPVQLGAVLDEATSAYNHVVEARATLVDVGLREDVGKRMGALLVIAEDALSQAITQLDAARREST